ncbi:MAG: FHA domain-containing protein [Roseibium sp.]|uniref:FHA domain-containing protein n=1 Tax=Roseibium sp. TaxID=1936156 RepID=UPI001B06566C|nr:FHA domain-containing protein [Roseibium sp.]MBO6895519.1 FHA domain-containing protein [Roseibium sp.]
MTLSVQLLQIPPTETVIKREFYLTGASFMIGRDFASDICLPDLSEAISPTHLVVGRTPSGTYTITDTSALGTAMNGQTLARGEPQLLKDGDIVSFAGYRLLFGIVEKQYKDDPVSHYPEIKFNVETDMSDDAPLLPDHEIEEERPEPDRGFSADEMDLDPDLMFDPFAEGPEMREPPQSEPLVQTSAPQPAFADPVEIMDTPHYQTAPALQNAHLRGPLYREQVSAAMEQALERFLDELDPTVLQDDYDAYIPRLLSRQKRYWKIHARQFAKKKASGEFRRTFLALFAEEMRKL